MTSYRVSKLPDHNGTRSNGVGLGLGLGLFKAAEASGSEESSFQKSER